MEPTPSHQRPMLVPIGRHAGAAPIKLHRHSVLLGSRSTASVRLKSSTVSRAHALLVVEANGCYIRDLASRSGTQVNGVDIRGVRLNHRDTVRIGKFTFKFRDKRPDLADLDNAPPGSLQGGDQAGPVELDDRVTLIGKRGEADVVLDDPDVSTAHAVIYECDGRRRVRDLGSRTGTVRNGQTIRDKHLDPGDTLVIGDSVFTFAAEDAPTPAVAEAPPLDTPADDSFGLDIESEAPVDETPVEETPPTRLPPTPRPAEPEAAVVEESPAVEEPPVVEPPIDEAPVDDVAADEPELDLDEDPPVGATDAGDSLPRLGWRSLTSENDDLDLVEDVVEEAAEAPPADEPAEPVALELETPPVDETPVAEVEPDTIDEDEEAAVVADEPVADELPDEPAAAEVPVESPDDVVAEEEDVIEDDVPVVPADEVVAEAPAEEDVVEATVEAIDEVADEPVEEDVADEPLVDVGEDIAAVVTDEPAVAEVAVDPAEDEVVDEPVAETDEPAVAEADDDEPVEEDDPAAAEADADVDDAPTDDDALCISAVMAEPATAVDDEEAVEAEAGEADTFDQEPAGIDLSGVQFVETFDNVEAEDEPVRMVHLELEVPTPEPVEEAPAAEAPPTVEESVEADDTETLDLDQPADDLDTEPTTEPFTVPTDDLDEALENAFDTSADVEPAVVEPAVDAELDDADFDAEPEIISRENDPAAFQPGQASELGTDDRELSFADEAEIATPVPTDEVAEPEILSDELELLADEPTITAPREEERVEKEHEPVVGFDGAVEDAPPPGFEDLDASVLRDDVFGRSDLPPKPADTEADDAEATDVAEREQPVPPPALVPLPGNRLGPDPAPTDPPETDDTASTSPFAKRPINQPPPGKVPGKAVATTGVESAEDLLEPTLPSSGSSRSRLRRAVMAAGAALVFVVAAIAAVYQFIPVESEVVGRISYENFMNRTEAERLAFEDAQKTLLFSDETRQVALALFRRSGNTTSGDDPGFLADATAFGAATLKPDFLEDDPETLELVHTGPGGPLAQERVAALLNALYELNEPLLIAAKEAEDTYKRHVNEIGYLETALTQNQTLIETQTAKMDAIPSPQRLETLREEMIAAREANDRANRAVDELEHKLRQLQRDERRMSEADRVGDVPSDELLDELVQRHSELQRTMDVLRGRAAAGGVSADEQAALDEAMSRFEQALATAGNQNDIEPALAAFIKSAQGQLKSTRDLTANLVGKQEKTVARLVEAQRELQENITKNRGERFDSDPHLQDIIQQLQMAERKLNNARAAGLDDEARRVEQDIKFLEEMMAAQITVLGDDPALVKAAEILREQISIAEAELKDSRELIEIQLANMEKSLLTQLPTLEKLPAAQRAIAEQLARQLDQVADARREFAGVVGGDGADAVAQLKKLEADAAALTARIEERRAALAEEWAATSTEAAADRRRRIQALEAELADATAARMATSKATRAATEAYTVAEDQIDNAGTLQARIDELQKRRRELESEKRTQEAAQGVTVKAMNTAIKPTEPQFVRRQPSQDRRPLFALLAGLAIGLPLLTFAGNELRKA